MSNDSEKIAGMAIMSMARDIDEKSDEIDRLRKDVIHWREARRTCLEAGDMMKAEIERLRVDLSKWKARAQVMREWMDCEQIDVVGAPYAWDEFVNDKPEAAGWFDEDGVPR